MGLVRQAQALCVYFWQIVGMHDRIGVGQVVRYATWCTSIGEHMHRIHITPPEWALGVTGVLLLFIMSIPAWNHVGPAGQQVVLWSATTVGVIGGWATRVLWRRRWPREENGS